MDMIQPATSMSVWYTGIDPEIDNLELISVLPIECVSLTIFHRHKRHTLKAHFSNSAKRYFELGGTQNKEVFWDLWCEQVKLLSALNLHSSKSETTAASSSSNSTLYITASQHKVSKKGQHQLWHYYGTKKYSLSENLSSWQTETSSSNTKPVISQHKSSTEVKTLYRNSKISNSRSSTGNLCRTTDENRLRIVSRFGEGIPENCKASLCFIEKKDSSGEQSINERIAKYSACELEDGLLEEALKIWEHQSIRKTKGCRHPRRYGFCPQALFLYGLGPWSVSPGERSSLQGKRAVSAVRIWRQPVDEDIRLPILRRQLMASLSCDTLINIQQEGKRLHFKNKLCSPYLPIIYFWTPEYWYRPKIASEAYKELHKHLMKLRTYLEQNNKKNEAVTNKRLTTRKDFISRSLRFQTGEKNDYDNKFHVSSNKSVINKRHNSGIMGYMFSKTEKRKTRMKATKCKNEDNRSSLYHLRKILKRDLIMAAWDFDSTTLAHQITLIDRDLFLKIPASELHILLWQQSSKNAPNIAAVIAFAHRISCLVATQVLQEQLLKARVQLLIRFINTAEKCNNINNFQSCHSVLAGLQSPGIFRLRDTWACLRHKHPSKYHIFEKLCHLYQNVCISHNQCTLLEEYSKLPYLPFIGDIFACLLGHMGRIAKTTAAKDPEQLWNQGISNKENNDITTSEESYRSSGLQHLLSYIQFLARRNSIESEVSAVSTFTAEKDSKYQIQDEMEDSFYSSKDCQRRGKCYCGESHTAYSDNVLANFGSFFVPLEPNEDLRIQRLRETTALLKKCQQAASKYSFCKNELAQDFLLKAHYKEEKANFYTSFHIE